MSRSLAELDAFLVGHWDMENNFLDKSGNSNHGTPTAIEWKPTARGMKPHHTAQSKFPTPMSMAGETESTVSVWVKNTGPYGSPRVITWAWANGCIIKYAYDELRIYTGSGYTIVSNSSGILRDNKWHHIVRTDDGSSLKFYIDGILVDTIASSGLYYGASNNHFFSQYDGAGEHWLGEFDGVRVYTVPLDADEVMALYNATKLGHGVLTHERSYTHRLSPEVDSSTVFATDMHTKNADRTLIDLSGNSNHGTVNGAVRGGGYFTDSLRFGGKDNVSCDMFSEISEDDDHTISMLIKPHSLQTNVLFSPTSSDTYFVLIKDTGGIRFKVDGVDIVSDDGKYSADSYQLFSFKKLASGSNSSIHVDAIKCVEGDLANTPILSSAYIGQFYTAGFELDADIAYMAIHKEYSESDIIAEFNSLAVLPLYAIDFSRYPSNTTVYSGNIPYSSMRVESGSFKIDGGQLVCVTDGIIKMRNAHDFDGSEYVSITADGVKSSGTTTVTAGTTTASIEQGSNLISIEMDAADVLDKLDIQFREPVE